jgi:hypothetical protein
MPRLLCLCVILLLSGCASFTAEHSRTLLMDRTTGEMKECTVDKWRIKESYDKYQGCVSDYEKQGYTIWSQY